jgi:uncharacterized protein YutE (UPF0331/DUF86 family)
MEIDYFDNLTHSIATARLLLQKANREGALIEGLCLYISLIDGLLRLAILYTRTQKSPTHTYNAEKKLIHQGDGERTYSEKKIYTAALNEQIISEESSGKLLDMHRLRNKAVHRFCISNISYQDIAKACTQLDEIYNVIWEKVSFLENGPNKVRTVKGKRKQEILKRIFRKILGD